MDPAEPDFEHLSAGIRLDPADAVFVDVIHTNGAPFSSLGYGLMQASGHVDFYVNGGEKQPGCPNQISGLLGSLFTFNTTGTQFLLKFLTFLEFSRLAAVLYISIIERNALNNNNFSLTKDFSLRCSYRKCTK